MEQPPIILQILMIFNLQKKKNVQQIVKYEKLMKMKMFLILFFLAQAIQCAQNNTSSYDRIQSYCPISTVLSGYLTIKRLDNKMF